MLFVHDFLSQKNVCGVGYASLDRDVRHHYDDGMLFDIEWPGIQRPLFAKSGKLAGWKYLGSFAPLASCFGRLSYMKREVYLPWHRTLHKDMREAVRHRRKL